MNQHPTPDSIKFLLDRLEHELEQTSSEALPEVCGELEKLRSRLWIRMLHSKPKVEQAQARVADKMLTAQEAARILGTTPTFLYKNSKKLPFARKFSRKCLRFSENGLRKWMESRRP